MKDPSWKSQMKDPSNKALMKDPTFRALLDEVFYRRLGHKESIKFRDTMDGIISCAIEMDKFIRGKCNDLQEKIESARQEYEGYLQFSSEDILELEREGLKLKKEGIDGWEYDLKCVALWSDKRNQIEDDLQPETRVELDAIEGEIEAYGFKINNLIEENMQLLFRSLFIAVYARFEIYLHNLCNALRESESLQLKPNDLHDKGITRSQKYLKKVACLNFPDNTKEWQAIKLLADIRNDLVHKSEHVFRREEANPKLLDYFWLDDPYWDVQSIDIMFSPSSLRNIVNTFVRFSKDIDIEWVEINDLREKFQKGPKHKK